MDHLTDKDYREALQQTLPPDQLHRRVRQHLLEVCDICQDRFEKGSKPEIEGGPSSGRGTRTSVAFRELPRDLRASSPQDLEDYVRLLSLTREAARRAEEDLARILALPRELWLETVERAHTRLQSRAFAERLIEEARASVRRDPLKAAALASLVRPALDRNKWRLANPWARTLVARAEAHRGNALRVAGDLAAAGSVFASLRAGLSMEPLGDLSAAAEIQSLEASYAIDQRNLDYAKTLLTSAADLFREVGDPLGLAKILVKHAHLYRTLGQPAAIIPLLDTASKLFDPAEHPTLHESTVQGRLNAYLDLDLPDKAESLLEKESHVYLDVDDDYMESMYLAMKARIHLGQRHYERAIAGFEAARDQMFRLDRNYDAILVSLYLADALNAAERSGEVRELARELVPMFQARRVEPETLASLRLVAQAGTSKAVVSALLADLRRKLAEAPVASRA